MLSTKALRTGDAAKVKVHLLERPAYLSDSRIFSQSSWGETKVSAWQCLLILGIDGLALLLPAPHS